MDLIEVWNNVLSDKKIRITYLDLSDSDLVERILQRNKSFGNFYISEWEHPLRGGKLEYHLHNEEKGKELKALYDNGKRAGNPFLVEVYSREDLENHCKTKIVT